MTTRVEFLENLVEKMRDAAIYYQPEWKKWGCVACGGENNKIAWELEDRERAVDNFEHDPGCIFDRRNGV
jgi:hypothetical protein